MSAEATAPAPAFPTVDLDDRTRLHTVAAAILFGLISAVYLQQAIALAAEAPYWMDEVLAVWTARLPSLGAIWTALLGGAEFSPPGYHVILHGILVTGATGPLAMRLPSIVAVYLAAVAIGLIVRRRSGWPVAAAAAAIVLSSGLFAYAVQARPYALVTAAVAWALFVWDDIAEDDAAGWRVPALALLLGAAVALHFYAVLLVGLIGLAEIVRSLACRRIRPRVLAAIALAALSILLWWPIMRAVDAFNTGDVRAESYYAQPSVLAASLTYARLLISPALPILAVVILVAVRAIALGRTASLEPRLTGLAVLFCYVPVVVLVFALAVSHTYNDRYAISAVLGVALLVAALVRSLGRHADTTALFLLAALVSCAATNPGGELSRPERPETLALLHRLPADLPIATGDGLRFLEMSEALPPARAADLVFLKVPAAIVSGDPTNQHQVERWAAMRPDLAVVDAAAFLCRTPRFLLLTDPAGGWDDVPAWLARYAQVAPTDDPALSRVSVESCPAG